MNAHLLAAVFSLLVCLPCLAGGEAKSASPPQKIIVGLYLNEILEVHLDQDYFVADFWLWFRWEASDAGNLAAGNYSAFDNLEIIDGQVTDKIGFHREQIGGTFLESARIIAKITHRFNMRSYPFDSHILMIRIEAIDKPKSQLEFVADNSGSGVSPNVELPGWAVKIRPLEIFTHNYQTDFGHIGTGRERSIDFSQFRFSFLLRKPIVLSVFKTLWATFLATLVALLVLFLKPSTRRVGLSIGALFTAVAAKISIASGVQSMAQFGFTDAIQLVSGIIIFLSIAHSIWVCHRIETGKSCEEAARRDDLRGAGFLFITYIILVSALFGFYT